MIAAKPDDPGTRMMEGESRLPKIILLLTSTRTHKYIYMWLLAKSGEITGPQTAWPSACEQVCFGRWEVWSSICLCWDGRGPSLLYFILTCVPGLM